MTPARLNRLGWSWNWLVFSALVALLATGGSAAPNRNAAEAARMNGLLQQIVPQAPAFTAALAAALDEPADPLAEHLAPSLVLLSYHEHKSEVRDLVVQVFRDPLHGENSVLNPDGIVRLRVGDELFDSADHLMDLLYHPVSYAGGDRRVARQQRAFEAGIEGDLTFLRELTVDPLHVIAILPDASRYLPRSLGGRVESIVVDSMLTFGEWHSQVSFITPNEDTARQVGFVVSAWRELASYLANNFAAHSSGRQLREAVQATRIQVIGNRVVSHGMIPAGTAVRITNELAGYGPPARVTICHNGVTLTISEAALPAHLAHGDTLGPCPPGARPGDNPPGQNKDREKGNNGVGNGEDPQPPGNPPLNDGPGTGPGNPGNRPSR